MNTFVSNLHISPSVGKDDTRFTVSTSVIDSSTTVVSTWNVGSVPIVLVDVQGADVMVTFDGSNPSSSNGHKLASGTAAEWSLATYSAAKWIRAGASDATVHASPFCV